MHGEEYNVSISLILYIDLVSTLNLARLLIMSAAHDMLESENIILALCEIEGFRTFDMQIYIDCHQKFRNCILPVAGRNKFLIIK